MDEGRENLPPGGDGTSRMLEALIWLLIVVASAALVALNFAPVSGFKVAAMLAIWATLVALLTAYLIVGRLGHPRRWFRYRLRTLFVLTTIVAVTCAVLSFMFAAKE